jgi:hypothetical protein
VVEAVGELADLVALVDIDVLLVIALLHALRSLREPMHGARDAARDDEAPATSNRRPAAVSQKNAVLIRRKGSSPSLSGRCRAATTRTSFVVCSVAMRDS